MRSAIQSITLPLLGKRSPWRRRLFHLLGPLHHVNERYVWAIQTYHLRYRPRR
jgi:hypothetical protein